MIEMICTPFGSSLQLENCQGGGGTHADVNTLIKFAKCKLLHLLAACFVHTVQYVSCSIALICFAPETHFEFYALNGKWKTLLSNDIIIILDLSH